MGDYVIREWILDPFPGDQAPRHIHHKSDEAFIVLSGQLEVEDSGVRRVLGSGQFHIVEAGSAHTFATSGDTPVHVLCVMSPEIDALVEALHDPGRQNDDLLWAEYNSTRVQD